MELHFRVVIPARLTSARCPRKVVEPIYKIGSKKITMLDEVYRRCCLAGVPVTVLADCSEIVKLTQIPSQRIVVPTEGRTGTHRTQLWAKAKDLDSSHVIINVQADEVYLDPKTIIRVIEHFRSMEAAGLSLRVTTVAAARCTCHGAAHVHCMARVNPTRDCLQAMFFTRTKVLGGEHHVGVYGLPMEPLRELPVTNHWSELESLEQMAWVSSGVPIDVVRIGIADPAINTPADLLNATQNFAARGHIRERARQILGS